MSDQEDDNIVIDIDEFELGTILMLFGLNDLSAIYLKN